MMQPRLIVLGIGNELMGDDGVGPVVARMLTKRLGPEVEVVEAGLAGMALSKYFTSGAPLIVIDAIHTEAEPGAVFRFDPDECGISSLRSNTSHGHGLPYLITNARLAGHAPDVTVYAVQVGDVRPRPDTLSPAVEQASRRVADLVCADVEGRVPAAVL